MLPSYPRDDPQADAEDDPQDQLRLLSLSADVGRALTARDALAVMLHRCAEALITHLDAAFARVWTLDEAEDVLVLRASAGQYTHLDGPHGRVPVGRFKIGLIAQERAPHLTNTVIGDPRVSDQEWAKREGMVAFAGYPLVVEDRLVGVVALFARQPLSKATLQALGSVADQIAVGIDRKYAEEATQEANRRTTRILESITDAFFALSTDWRFTYLNDQAERLLSRARADLLGRNVWDEFPAAVGTDFDRQYHRALDEQVAVTFEAYYPPPLDTWFEVRAYPSPDGLSVYFHDITEQVRRRQRERFLAELAERARTLTAPEEVIADAVNSLGEFMGVSRCVFVDIDIAADTCTCHADYRAGDSVASMAGVFPISAFGEVVVAEYGAGRAVVVEDVRADPAQVPPESVAAYDAVGIRAHVGVPVVHSARLVSCIGAHSAASRRWRAEEVELLQTVVERTWLTVEVLRQGRALAREAEATARILDSITDASFTLDREWRVTRVNDQAGRLMTKTRDQILGRNVWEVFPGLVGSTFEHKYRRAVAESVPVSFEVFYAPLDAWLEVRAYPSPDGLSVFYQDVTARKRAEEERERMLAEQRARAEREALVNRINGAIRATGDPELIQETAAALVGEALGADRCYFSVYDPQRDAVRIARDWRREGLPSVAGEYRLAEYGDYVGALYAQGTAAVADAQAPDVPPDVRRVLGGFGIRALLAVPLLDEGRFAAALAASMSGGPRAWTPDEVALMEAVLTQTRTATEEARLRLREHRIAEQLQAALQPPTPASVPGLALAAFYRPALEDEGVGGDFSDVFSTDKGMTFLVVGDLSGKGLAAASQVAMVRQMLRFALYNGHTVAGPVGSLNATLADNGLLDGFSTVFVGRYDAGARALTYVNCGQDAGLVLRAGAGTVQTLPPTGPVLGAISGAVYAEETVTLAAGDALALFTDGLTEAGPTRASLLTGDGVADLLRAQAGATDPNAIVAGVMAGVDAHAGAGVRDDQCLLVAVAQGLLDDRV